MSNPDGDKMPGEGQIDLEDLNMRIMGLHHDRQPSATQIASGLQIAGTYVEVTGFIQPDENSAADLIRVMGTSEKRQGELNACLIRMA